MSETDASTSDVRHLNDTLTIVGEAYCVRLTARYVTSISREDGWLGVGVHMTEDEARDLCAGLKDALR